MAKKSVKEEYEAVRAELDACEKAILEAEDDEAEKKAIAARDAKVKDFHKISEKYYNEPVAIRLFKDDGKYKDDVYVGWNSRSFLIQRGVEVEVPRGVAEIIRNSEEQRNAAAMTMEEYSNRYERETKKRGLA